MKLIIILFYKSFYLVRNMEFKTYFRDELDYLKHLAQESSESCPHLESYFSPSAADYDVAYLVEHFAFLATKLRQKIEDAFPEITQNVLFKIWPTPLKPLPASTILQFTPRNKDSIQFLKKEVKVFKKQDQETMTEDFLLCRDICVLPLQTDSVSSYHSLDMTILQLKLKWIGCTPKTQWQDTPLRFYLGNDIQMAGLLKLWFSQYLERIDVQCGDEKLSFESSCVNLLKVDEQNAVLPAENLQHACLQLVQEYFSLAHVSDFIDIDINSYFKQADLLEPFDFQINITFNRPFPAGKQLEVAHFQLNCVPALNFFSYVSEGHVLNQLHHTISVPDEARLYTIKRIYSVNEADKGKRSAGTSYSPVNQFVAERFDNEINHFYYQYYISKDVTDKEKHELIFIDSKGEKANPTQQELFGYELLCTSYYKEQQPTSFELVKGTIDIPGRVEINIIAPISATVSPLIDSQKQWMLLSYFSLSPYFLSQEVTLKQFLSDLNFYTYVHNGEYLGYNRQIEGIKKVEFKQIDHVFKGVVQRGFHLKVTLNHEYFLDQGEMYRLGILLSKSLIYCISDNHFLQIEIHNDKTGDSWQLPVENGVRNQM